MSTDLPLALAYLDRHPQLAIRALQELPTTELLAFLGVASVERQDVILSSLTPDSAAAVVAALSAEDRTPILERLPLDVVARLVRCLHQRERDSVFAAMTGPRRRRLERAVRFGEDSAGGAADPDPPTIMDHQDCASALKHSYRRAPDLPYVFVTDRERHLVGVVSKRELSQARPDAPVAEVMQHEVQSLSAYAPLGAVLGHPAWHDVDVLPVVDASAALVGVLTHKALRRRLGSTVDGGAASPATSKAVALGTAYCDLLARALVTLTTAPSGPTQPPSPGGAP